MECLNDALALCDMGVSVIPIVDRQKRAAVKWRTYQSERPDRHEVRDWFSGRDDLGLGVVCGPVSDNLVVRDFDHRFGFERWRDAHRRLAGELPLVVTPRGFHVYCRVPEASQTGTVRLKDGELRGSRSLVVAPPSQHPSGNSYIWHRGRPAAIPIVDIKETGFLFEQVCHREDREHIGGIKTLGGVPVRRDQDWSTISVERYVPLKAGERHWRLFDLILELRRRRPEATVDEARPIIERWWELSRHIISTKLWMDSWLEAKSGWPLVKCFHAHDPTVTAMNSVDTSDISESLTGFDEPYVRLVGLCRQLATENGDGEFFLACRKIEELIPEINYRSAARAMKELCDTGILVIAQQGTKTKATRYRYVGVKK